MEFEYLYLFYDSIPSAISWKSNPSAMLKLYSLADLQGSFSGFICLLVIPGYELCCNGTMKIVCDANKMVNVGQFDKVVVTHRDCIWDY